MKKSSLATWAGAVIGTLLAIILNVAFAHGSDKGWVTEEFHKTYPLSASGRVDLENVNGPVHISAWDQNQVKVDAVKRADDERGLKETGIRVDANPDWISISTHYNSHDEDWNRANSHGAIVEYTITVPRNARLDEIKLVNGPLEVNGVLGTVHASCVNGKLVARGLAKDVELSTVNGPIEVTFDHMPAGSIQLQSVNGPVHLTLPSDAKASIQATTVRGRIGNDFGLHTNNHFVGHDMHGELGGGGTQVRLNNVNGPIEVHHASDGRAVSPAKDAGSNEDGRI